MSHLWGAKQEGSMLGDLQPLTSLAPYNVLPLPLCATPSCPSRSPNSLPSSALMHSHSVDPWVSHLGARWLTGFGEDLCQSHHSAGTITDGGSSGIPKILVKGSVQCLACWDSQFWPGVGGVCIGIASWIRTVGSANPVSQLHQWPALDAA